MRLGPLQLFRGVGRPFTWSAEVAAGVTLAAIAVPEALGYARIAGMPPATGLFTLLLPVVAYVAFGASRQLVVGADSATAAIVASGLAAHAVAGSDRYVELAAMLAIVTGVLLLVARIARLGFLADFLSRTMLVGFLTGVGIQVAARQLPEMLGIHVAATRSLPLAFDVVRSLGSVDVRTVLISAVTLVVVGVGEWRLPRVPRVPWALLAVVVGIVVVRTTSVDVATVADVAGGLPGLPLPSFGVADLRALGPTAIALLVVVLAQSAVTARSFADRHDERNDLDGDLVGLGAANLAAGFTGTFVVNGSPTRTEIVDRAGGRSQVAQLVSVGAVVVVLVAFAGSLTDLPTAVLCSIVFLIAIRLVQVPAVRDIARRRPAEGAVAVATAATVVLFGVSPGIVFAMLASVIVHLRHSYRPNTRLVGRDGDRWRLARMESAVEVEPGLAICYLSKNLYYANASYIAREVLDLVGDATPPLRWVCLMMASVDDVDLSASEILRRLRRDLDHRGVTLVLCSVEGHVRHELERDGLVDQIGSDRFFDFMEDVVAAYRARSV